MLDMGGRPEGNLSTKGFTSICGGIEGTKKKEMTSAGLDPATLSVLTIRDNQLHQPAICWEFVIL